MWLLQYVDKRPDKANQDTIDEISKTAHDKWSLDYEGEYPTKGIGIASLRVYDVQTTTLPNPTSLSVWRIAIAAATTWQDWINVTLDVNLYVIISGIFDWTPNPSLSEIRFEANGIKLPVESIEYMFASDNGLAWFSKPFSVSPENNLTARLYGNVAQTELLGLIGFAIAKRNYLILET